MELSGLKINLENIQQKARERTVKTQNVEYDLDTLVSRIKKGSIKLDPDYQRRHRWTEETSSRLIESLILNIPIPVIFISQDIDVDEEVSESTARYTVIDGQQRLTAIYDFLEGNYPLTSLEVLPELEGCYYKDLPPFLIRRFEERTIKCLRIDSTVDPQVKYDIFERLNTGAVKLEPQELRNATSRGPFNELTKRLAVTPEFRTLIQVDNQNPASSTKVQKMEDVELVLRFFALRNDRYLALKKGFKEFITQSLNEFNQLEQDQIRLYGEEFRAYMTFIHNGFGPFAFAKKRPEGDGLKRMSSFNAAVYDAVAVGLAQVFTPTQLVNRTQGIIEKMQGYDSLFNDTDFFSAVSGSVNDAAKVTTRITKMIAYLQR
jgi:uncharacterized protein with ParB-like and HNH nuclease domain